MKKSIELKKQMDALRLKVEGLEKQEQFDEAAKEAKGLTDLYNQFMVADALEKAEMAASAGCYTPVTAVSDMSVAKMRNRAFNKAVFGAKMGFAPMTDEESAYAATIEMAAGTPGQVGATPAKGGYLLPETEFQSILEFRRVYTELKRFCSVVPVNTRTGKRPTIGKENGTLIAFDELNEIHKDDLDFGQITFDIADYGDIIPVSNTLLADVDVSLVSLIGNRFAKKAMNTENNKIMEIVNALTPATITDNDGIGTALNVTLDPAISATAEIFTNQSGFDYLDKLKDTTKRPLLTTSLADPTRKLYKGRPINVLPNTLFTISGYMPFLVGSMADLIHFYERQGVEVALSTEAGFTMNATLIRAIERFGVKKVDEGAAVLLQLAE